MLSWSAPLTIRGSRSASFSSCCFCNGIHLSFFMVLLKITNFTNAPYVANAICVRTFVSILVSPALVIAVFTKTFCVEWPLSMRTLCNNFTANLFFFRFLVFNTSSVWLGCLMIRNIFD